MILDKDVLLYLGAIKDFALTKAEKKYLMWLFSAPNIPTPGNRWSFAFPSFEEVEGLMELAEEYPASARMLLYEDMQDNPDHVEVFKEFIKEVQRENEFEEYTRAEAEAREYDKSQSTDNQLWPTSQTSFILSNREARYFGKYNITRGGKEKGRNRNKRTP